MRDIKMRMEVAEGMDIPHKTRAILPSKNIMEMTEVVVGCLNQGEVGGGPRCKDLHLMVEEEDMINVARDEGILQMLAQAEEADRRL